MTGDRDRAFAPIGTSDHPPSAERRGEWSVIAPIPDIAPRPPERHYKLGAPSERWEYIDAEGRLLGYVYRFETGNGRKELRPLTFSEHVKSAARSWRWQHWPRPRPLYGLDRLARAPESTVVICEGERAAAAAQVLLPDCVAITSSGGSSAAASADWSPLRERDVAIWPDHDDPGRKYAAAVVEQLSGHDVSSIRIVQPSAELPEGWDAMDALSAGWGQTQAVDLINAAGKSDQVLSAWRNTSTTAASDCEVTEMPASADKPAGAESSPRSRSSLLDTAVALLEQVDLELWTDESRETYASFEVNEHWENWPIRSRQFKQWLDMFCYSHLDRVVRGSSLEDLFRILEAKAMMACVVHKPAIRIGFHGGNIYHDLANDEWQAVKITPHNAYWVVDRPPVKFLRKAAMRPLPGPEEGGRIEALKSFINVASDEDFNLIVAWLVAALRDRGPYPILCIGGEQGSSKSTLSKLLRLLVDPSVLEGRGPPSSSNDLAAAVENSWCLVFDNLSGVSSELSDGLCRIASGAGIARRALYTNNDEVVTSGARPICLNGIPSLANRPDLTDRAITVTLPAILEERRCSDDEIDQRFEDARPCILGALYDAVSAALRRYSQTKLDRLPRMANFARWVTAAESGLGWEDGAFLRGYDANRKDAFETALENDPIAQAILNHVITEHSSGWEGTATELLEYLNERISETVKKSRFWPTSVQQLGNRLSRVEPLLRERGVRIVRRKAEGGNKRIIRITIQE